MGTGIIVCGLNGSGKSTLGKALAEKLEIQFIDNEDLYFPKTDPNYMFASPRTQKQAAELLFREINAHGHFVFASVKGDYGEIFYPFFCCAVLIHVPKEIRLQRVRDRSFQKFGNRMLAGGDLHEQEERFFDLVKSRSESSVEKWVRTLNCPIICVDGIKPTEENVDLIIERIRSMTGCPNI